MNKFTISLGGGVLALGLAVILNGIHQSVQSRIGPQHVFALSKVPPFLTEELALAKARDTLREEGKDPAIWQPQRDGRTSAPDGRIDNFAARSSINSNAVVFVFTNGSATKLFVSAELVAGRVICRTAVGK